MTNRSSKQAVAQDALVHLIEVWETDAASQSMVLKQHCRMRGTAVDIDNSQRRVRQGEGVAGIAWNQRSAVILQESPSELLERIGAQNGLKLSALVAYPVMRGQEVLAVIVLGIGAGPGAIEVWGRDDRDELSVVSSYYSGLKSFELISRYVHFPKGAGMPGTVWKSGMPRLATDLPTSDRFMRSFAADEAELNTGLGLPVGSSAGNSDSVLLLLSSHAQPIAVGFEIWNPGEAMNSETGLPQLERISAELNLLRNASAESADHPSPELPAGNVLSSQSELLVAKCWEAGLPVLFVETNTEYPTGGAIGVRAHLAIPIYRGMEKSAVVRLVF